MIYYDISHNNIMLYPCHIAPSCLFFMLFEMCCSSPWFHVSLFEMCGIPYTVYPNLTDLSIFIIRFL